MRTRKSKQNQIAKTERKYNFTIVPFLTLVHNKTIKVRFVGKPYVYCVRENGLKYGLSAVHVIDRSDGQLKIFVTPRDVLYCISGNTSLVFPKQCRECTWNIDTKNRLSYCPSCGNEIFEETQYELHSGKNGYDFDLYLDDQNLIVKRTKRSSLSHQEKEMIKRNCVDFPSFDFRNRN